MKKQKTTKVQTQLLTWAPLMDCVQDIFADTS